jgi:hypothetical protein
VNVTRGAKQLASLTEACPDCELGLRAREQLWQQDFSSHLFALLLPLAIVALTAVGLGRALR